jgi:hypothetical protein
LGADRTRLRYKGHGRVDHPAADVFRLGQHFGLAHPRKTPAIDPDNAIFLLAALVKQILI